MIKQYDEHTCRKIRNEQKPIQLPRKQPAFEPIILISRRGTRVETNKPCDECFLRRDNMWRYAKSSRGTVYICSCCKDTVFQRSFGNIDVLNRAFRGGHVEGNRRRH